MTNCIDRIENVVGWNEAVVINRFAVFLGYLSMAIKGLGFLVLTWTTVVLLGGFVSILQKKDFWCLTFITLAQMAGIFDAALNEQLRYMMNSARGLMMGIWLGTVGESPEDLVLRPVLAFTLMCVQLMVVVTVLCPLALIYVFGILMSTGVSLWRLIEHDYHGNSEGEASNLVPALDTLYYLVLLQGVLFCYKFFLGRTGKNFARYTAAKCDDSESELELVSNYLHETVRGCEKDPSFVKGRNLITHAIDMIGSHSPADCDSGVKILSAAISIVESYEKEEEYSEAPFFNRVKGISDEQQNLLKHLLLSTSSSSHILQKLLETLDSRGTHDRAIRHKAAKIVERIALDINLEQFPRGIEHISSLFGTFQQYNIVVPKLRQRLHQFASGLSPTLEVAARGLPATLEIHRELQNASKELLLQGLCIVRKLAADGNNCRVISGTQDLVSKIMAPVTSDMLKHTTDGHGPWSDVVAGSMEVMIQLTGASGETGTKLRREISSCEEAINTLRRIIRCKKCNKGLKERAIELLTRLCMDIDSSRCGANFAVISSSSREDFLGMLVDIFTGGNTTLSTRICAGAALSMLCCHGGSSDAITVIQTGGGDVIASLTRVLVEGTNTTCQQAAAAILEHLCTQYADHDACRGKLKKAMAGVMPEVIKQIHCYGDEISKGEAANTFWFVRTVADIENQWDESSAPAFLEVLKEPIEIANYLSSLLSLCGTVYHTFITELGLELAGQFHQCSFIDKLEDIVVNISEYPTDENLLLLKAIGKIVISMMKHNDSIFVKPEVLKNLIEALSSASTIMLELDYYMVFRFANSGSTSTTHFSTATPPSKLSSCTLASVVKEAEELHAKMPSTSVSDEGSICLHMD